MRWRKRERSIGRSRSEEAWHRRVSHHQATVSAARTPDQQLAATFDRFRARAARGHPSACGAMVSMLVDHAAQLQDFTASAGGVRAIARLKSARTPQGKLRAAFDWYRVEIAAMRRDYGDSEEMRRLLAGDMHDVASRLNAAAVALEPAA